MKFSLAIAGLFFATSFSVPAQTQMVDPPSTGLAPIPASISYAPANPSVPSIFVVGDSTAALWGPPFVSFFDTAKVNVVKAGAGGRSSRTFISEGLWARVIAQVRPHDIVLLQFGRNDTSKVNDDTRARGSIPGTGDETQSIVNGVTHQPEVVHTFGWYTQKMVREMKAKGATVIVMSMTPRNKWVNSKLALDDDSWGLVAETIAKEEHVTCLDINHIMIAEYNKLGEEKTKTYFTKDQVHFNGPGGPELNAAWVVQGLKGLPDSPIAPYLSAKGAALEPLRAP